MANRNLLHISKVKDFEEWLKKDGWTIEETKCLYEVLRARKDGRKKEYHMGDCIENNYSRSIGNSRSIGRHCLCGVSRPLSLIVIHCTATRVNVDFSNVDLLRAHRAKGMRCIGAKNE